MNGSSPAEPDNLRENLSRIEEQIAAACRRAGRPRSEVTLLAASKMHSAAAILEAASLGIACFGESLVQEFQQKRVEIERGGYSIARGGESEAGSRVISVHLIGHLQSNKSARAVELYSSIDTLDSVRLGERLNDAAAERHRRLPVMLEIKLSPEEAKSGLEPDSSKLAELLERLPEFSALEPRGMMTVPPWSDDPEQARPYFRRLRALRDRLAAAHPGLDLGELSMGMSHDFAAAVEEGATLIRVGTGLFGARRLDKPGQQPTA